jgi:hypothetical protein
MPVATGEGNDGTIIPETMTVTGIGVVTTTATGIGVVTTIVIGTDAAIGATGIGTKSIHV